MSGSIKSLAQMGLGCVLLILCSWCAIPLGVPITLQLLGLFILIGFLGTKKAMGSLLSYLLLGSLGLPVFAGFGGGIGTFLGPTGGYLLGLIPLTLVCGWLYPKGTSLWCKGMVFGAGLLLDYILGTLWYLLGYTKGEASFLSAFMVCVVPFLLPDLLKILGSIWVLKRLEGKQHEILG